MQNHLNLQTEGLKADLTKQIKAESQIKSILLFVLGTLDTPCSIMDVGLSVEHFREVLLLKW